MYRKQTPQDIMLLIVILIIIPLVIIKGCVYNNQRNNQVDNILRKINSNNIEYITFNRLYLVKKYKLIIKDRILIDNIVKAILNSEKYYDRMQITEEYSIVLHFKNRKTIYFSVGKYEDNTIGIINLEIYLISKELYRIMNELKLWDELNSLPNIQNNK